MYIHISSIFWHSMWSISPPNAGKCPDQNTISVPGHKQVPFLGLQVLYDWRRIIPHIDPQFLWGPIYVRCGGEIGTYPTQPSYRRWEILVHFHVLTATGRPYNMQFVEFVYAVRKTAMSPTRCWEIKIFCRSNRAINLSSWQVIPEDKSGYVHKVWISFTVMPQSRP